MKISEKPYIKRGRREEFNQNKVRIDIERESNGEILRAHGFCLPEEKEECIKWVNEQIDLMAEKGKTGRIRHILGLKQKVVPKFALP